VRQILFIVSRDEPKLLAYARQAFSGAETVQVIQDRRFGERRQAVKTGVVERRHGERRSPQNTRDLQILGWTFARAESQTAWVYAPAE